MGFEPPSDRFGSKRASWGSITSGGFQYHAAYRRQYHAQKWFVLVLEVATVMAAFWTVSPLGSLQIV